LAKSNAYPHLAGNISANKLKKGREQNEQTTGSCPDGDAVAITVRLATGLKNK